jgi:methyl-accepting chemotaxis protein
VTQASQEAGAASEQVTSAAGDLSQQSETLKSVVSQFLASLREGAGNRRIKDDPDFNGPERRSKNSGQEEVQAA